MTTGRHRTRTDATTLGPRELLAAIGLLLLLLLAPALAHAQGAGSDSLNLWWTSPGDDGWVGTGVQYDVRTSDVPITEDNFAGATAVPGAPAPSPSGRLQHMVVRGLSRGTVYYIALKTRDEAGNWSALSNVLRWSWPFDATPPASPSNLTASVLSQGTVVRLSWRPNSESDLLGYNVYRAPRREGPWEKLNATRLTVPEFHDDKLSGTWTEAWYQVSAYDAGGIESPRTAPMFVPRQALATGVFEWGLATGYPNPSRTGETVHLPLTVPASAEPSVVDILDDAGQRVRRLTIDVPGGGLTELLWDGLNDHGRAVAPGLYRAWLNAGGKRQVVRLVRLP